MAHAEMVVRIEMTAEVRAIFDESRRTMAELRALAEKVVASPYTGYAVEELADWLQAHPMTGTSNA